METELQTWLTGVRERLRAARLALGLTHRGAGARTGVPFQTVTRVETGKMAPSLNVIYRMATGYGADLCAILCGEPAAKKPRRPKS